MKILSGSRMSDKLKEMHIKKEFIMFDFIKKLFQKPTELDFTPFIKECFLNHNDFNKFDSESRCNIHFDTEKLLISQNEINLEENISDISDLSAYIQNDECFIKLSTKTHNDYLFSFDKLNKTFFDAIIKSIEDLTQIKFNIEE